MLHRYDSLWGMRGPFTASLLDNDAVSAACAEEGIDESSYSRFERIAIIAAARALRLCPEINPAEESVLFIISTTKGGWAGEGDPLPAESAGRIAGRFGNPNSPIVVCNACISGLCAQTEAAAALESGRWEHAVVIGADILTPFILSGFCSLNATSQQPCRPFDEERCGLNLGEAAACIIYGNRSPEECRGAGWHIVSGALSNDAFHITNPSKNAEGAYIALRETLKEADMQDIAFINVHGTATLFNDEMEAVAIDRAPLSRWRHWKTRQYLPQRVRQPGSEQKDKYFMPQQRGARKRIYKDDVGLRRRQCSRAFQHEERGKKRGKGSQNCRRAGYYT